MIAPRAKDSISIVTEDLDLHDRFGMVAIRRWGSRDADRFG